MKKVLAIVLALVLCLGCLAACGGNGGETPDKPDAAGDNYAANNTEYVIGATGPLTGDAASYGISVQNGAQIARRRGTQKQRHLKRGWLPAVQTALHDSHQGRCRIFGLIGNTVYTRTPPLSIAKLGKGLRRCTKCGTICKRIKRKEVEDL